MKPRIAYSEQDAWDQIDQIDTCCNCQFMIDRDLFGGRCIGPETGFKFTVRDTDRCECFSALEKKVSYWIDKLVEMALEFSGQNDFNRQLAYHQKNGTDQQFLFGKNSEQ